MRNQNQLFAELLLAFFALNTYTADFSGDVIRPLVSATQHHFVNDDLLTPHDNAIRTYNSTDSAKHKRH